MTIESSWPFVAVFVADDNTTQDGRHAVVPLFVPRVVGTWAPHEKQIAIDWACDWWQSMFGSEPTVVVNEGKFSDDHYATIGDGSSTIIYLCQIGEAYRTDVSIKSIRSIKPNG